MAIIPYRSFLRTRNLSESCRSNLTTPYDPWCARITQFEAMTFKEHVVVICLSHVTHPFILLQHRPDRGNLLLTDKKPQIHRRAESELFVPSPRVGAIHLFLSESIIRIESLHVSRATVNQFRPKANRENGSTLARVNAPIR